MEAGENPARARRRDARKAPFYPKPQFGDKPLGDREGEGSAQSRNTFRKTSTRINASAVWGKQIIIF